MSKAPQNPDYGLMSEALNLARTGRYRTLSEIENRIGTLRKLSRSERTFFDQLCEKRRKEHPRNAGAQARAIRTSWRS